MRSLILILLIVIIIGIAKTPKMKEHFNKQACSAKITDIQYLHHMIPHHQVAVDMSILLQKKTRNPTMHNIIRKLMWIQNYEIGLMKHFLKAMPSKFSDYKDMNRHYISTISDFIKPNLNNKKKFFFKNLNFNNIDKKKFPIIELKKRLNEYHSTPIIINAANEILVDQFLKKKIPFNSFYHYILKVLNDRNYKKYAVKKPKSISQIFQIDQWSRNLTYKKLK